MPDHDQSDSLDPLTDTSPWKLVGHGPDGSPVFVAEESHVMTDDELRRWRFQPMSEALKGVLDDADLVIEFHRERLSMFASPPEAAAEDPLVGKPDSAPETDGNSAWRC